MSDSEGLAAEIERRADEVKRAREDGEHSRALAKAYEEARSSSMRSQAIEQRHGGEVKVVTDPVPMPIHDLIERRAISLRMAIEAKGLVVNFDRSESGKGVEDLIAAARVFEKYIAGLEGEVS